MVIFSYARAYYQDYQIKQEISQLQKQAKEYQAKKLELLEQINYIKSDQFVEQKARTDLNLVKGGEKTVVIPTATANNILTNRQSATDVVKSVGGRNYSKWWNLFMWE